jgi:hypothetical protein
MRHHRTTPTRPPSKPPRARQAPGQTAPGGNVPGMAFHWRLTPADRTSGDTNPPSSFPSQSDAESWLGEAWRELSAAGVQSVTLVDGQQVLYEMSLADQ